MRPAPTRLLVAACGVLLSTAVAHAQAPGQAAPAATAVAPAANEPAARSGFLIGVALGPGSIAAVNPIDGEPADSFGGFSVNVQVGGLLNPRLALVVDLWGVFHEDEQRGAELTLVHNLVTATAKYWATPRLWLAGGVGRANYTIIQDDNTYDSGSVPALMGALGYELSRSRSFAFDVQARFGVAEYDEGELRNGALVLGLNWY